ncbi:MAG: hypothetical protein SNJ57_09385 [Cyanobacteriota bacterium]
MSALQKFFVMPKTILIRNHKLPFFGSPHAKLPEIITAIPIDEKTINQINKLIEKKESIGIKSGEFMTESITFVMPGYFYYYTRNELIQKGIDLRPLFRKDEKRRSFILIEKSIDDIGFSSCFTTGARISFGLLDTITIFNSMKYEEYDLISETIYLGEIEEAIQKEIFKKTNYGS